MNFHVWVLLLLVAAIAGSSAYVAMNVRLREVHPFIMWAPVFSVALAIASIVFLALTPTFDRFYDRTCGWAVAPTGRCHSEPAVCRWWPANLMGNYIC